MVKIRAEIQANAEVSTILETIQLYQNIPDLHLGSVLDRMSRKNVRRVLGKETQA